MRSDKYWQVVFYVRETIKDYMARYKKQDYHETFLEALRKSGKDHVAVYKQAGMDRRYYSKMVGGKIKLPSKSAMIRLGLAMHLDEAGMQRLLHSCGYHLSKSFEVDLVILYCLSKGEYDLWRINAMLDELDLPLLE